MRVVKIHQTGFQTLTEELSTGISFWDQNSHKEKIRALQQMFVVSEDDEGSEVRTLTRKYHRFKRSYAKNLGFDPDLRNLSKNRNFISMLMFSQHLSLNLRRLSQCTSTLARKHLTSLKGCEGISVRKRKE